jgi:hypothetical protein
VVLQRHDKARKGHGFSRREVRERLNHAIPFTLSLNTF